jgi:hypothetical protein
MTDALETRIRDVLATIKRPDNTWANHADLAPRLARALEAAKSKLPLVEVWRYQEADDAFIAALDGGNHE